MNKPEIIKMHLEILYKSVGFISEQKIQTNLEEFRKAKEQKKREKEQRVLLNTQMKKQKGKQTTNNKTEYLG